MIPIRSNRKTAGDSGGGAYCPRGCGKTWKLGPVERGAGLRALHQQAPTVGLRAQIGGISYAVTISGTLAYAGTGPRLAVLDVSNPAQPALRGQTGVLPGVVRGVAVAGDFTPTLPPAVQVCASSMCASRPAPARSVSTASQGSPMPWQSPAPTRTSPIGMEVC